MAFSDDITIDESDWPMLVRSGGRNVLVASFSQYASNCKEGFMEKKDVKKFLAGFGIASLIAGASLVGGPDAARAADQPGGSG